MKGLDQPREVEPRHGGGLDLLRAESDAPEPKAEVPHVGPIEHFDHHRPLDKQRDMQDLQWPESKAPAGVERLSANDIRQGAIGDCWLLASAGAVASRSPEKLRERIEPLKQGGARVTLDDGVRPPRTHRVDATFPEATLHKGGHAQRVELHADADHVTWPALLEKTAAGERPGGYQEIHRGGNYEDCRRALEDFSGQRAEVRSMASRSDAEILHELGGDQPAVVGIRRMDKSDPADVALFDKLELSQQHAYWVDHVNGDRVVLGNPHGFHSRPELTVSELRQVAWQDRYVVGGLDQ